MTSILILTACFLIVAIGIIMLVLVYQKKQLQYFREREQLKVTFEKEILESKLEIQEQTLKNISQEIHDNIGQVLTLAKLHINTMNCEEPVALKDKINDSRTLITKAIQDLRDISKSLNTDYVTELGLQRAVENELELIKKTGAYKVRFQIEKNPYRLEEQKELILFRIVQEVLQNIIKHAKATAIEVQLIFEPGEFILKITDNGIGFDAGKLAEDNYKSHGLGIRNMHNRANMINTGFNLFSSEDEGTTVVLTLPLQKN